MLAGIAIFGATVNLDEWKLKQLAKTPKNYSHFDLRVTLDNCFSYIISPEQIKRHGFYPFIHHIIETRKVKKGKKMPPKQRHVYYAAHIDSLIYSYYSYLLNEKYNTRVKQDDLNSSVVAYRTNLSKCNIDFAAEAIRFIINNSPCCVMIGDFTDFFDNLNHQYLKERLCDLLTVDKLPDDYYAVFKNITRFSYVELEDLLKLRGLENSKQGRREFNSNNPPKAVSLMHYRQQNGKIHPNPNCSRGVPQGSPISSVLANIYMLEADKQIYDYVSSKSGLYMRYSDDFIIIIPGRKADFSEHHSVIRNILNSVPDLVLKAEKTKVFAVSEGKVINCTSDFTGSVANGKDTIEFLGFAFDGNVVRLRDKTISKYYNRLDRKCKTILRNHGVTKKGNRISCKNLYTTRSHKGSKRYAIAKFNIKFDKDLKGNFFDYLYRCRDIFGDLFRDKIIGRDMHIIRKRLRG